ncbi:MAG: hypothetical protein ACON4Z_03690 [Planctomycetota bacterium]
MSAPSRSDADAAPCPWCGATRGVVRVHGHAQCRACGTNVEPCCSGDVTVEPATLAVDALGAGCGPGLFPALFDRLGGRTASVTAEALCHALQLRLGCDLDEARDVLTAAQRAGWILAPSPGVHRLGAGARPDVD